jgi:hypothetical protein
MRTEVTITYISLWVLIFTSSCKSLPGEEESKAIGKEKRTSSTTKVALRAPRDFDFKNSNKVRVHNTIFYKGLPLANTPIAILDSYNNTILKTFTDNNGYIDTYINVPPHIKVIFIEPLTLGTNIRISIHL